MESCVFCRIVKGKELANYVYENDDVLAFLDDRPVNEGHTLVITKEHFENIFAVPDEALSKVFLATKKVAGALMQTEHADGIRIVQNNGRAAHQRIFHFHVIPEYEGENQRVSRQVIAYDRLEEMAAKIRKVILLVG
jgi:diadenosine tetraphosphate (Ap4A) HIT family hydrolase